MSYFDNKVIYITGAASGLALEAAKQLAAKGAKLALFDKDDLANAEAIIRSHAKQQGLKTLDIQSHSLDVTDADQTKLAVETVAKQLPPDICMHFAGVSGPWTFDEMSQTQFEKVVTINLFGTRNWLAAVRPYLSKGKQVMVTGSMSSFVGSYSYTSYCASKFGVWGMMQALRCEWQPLGIDITVFAPPPVKTALTEGELGVMDPVGLAMKKFAGEIPIEEAIAVLLEGLEHKDFLVVPGKMAKFLRLQLRLFPTSVVNKISDLQINFMQKKASKKASR